MVIHQAIGVDLNFPEPGNVGEQVEKTLPPFVFHEDITAGLATVHDVIISPGVFDTQWSSHADLLLHFKKPRQQLKADLTPSPFAQQASILHRTLRS